MSSPKVGKNTFKASRRTPGYSTLSDTIEVAVNEWVSECKIYGYFVLYLGRNNRPGNIRNIDRGRRGGVREGKAGVL